MSTTSQIQEIYVGLLGRAADAEGLAYWTAEINSGVLSIEQLRANIVNEQPEWQAGLGLLSRSELVDSLYSNLFGREPDAAGATYWTTGGGASVNADQLVLALSNGASVADRAILDKKTTAATYYTNSDLTYSSSSAASAVSGVVDTESLANSRSATDALVAAGASTTALGSANNEVITGDASSSKYTAVFTTNTSNTATTLDAADTITDASNTDNDTLTITTNNDVIALTDTGTILNIETIDVRVDTTTTAAATSTEIEFEATDFTGVKTYKFDVVKDVSAISILDLTDAEDGSTVIASSDFKTVDVEVETAGDDLTIYTQAAGTSGTPTAVDVTTTAAGDVTIYGSSFLDVDSVGTGVLTVTAGEINPISAAAHTVIIATATEDDLTIDTAEVAVIVNATAAGDIAITNMNANQTLTATAGGSITLTNGSLALGGAANIATTSAVLSSVGTSAGSVDELSSATLSGNGAAATYNFTSGADALSDVTVTGSQDVKLQMTAIDVESISDELNITDNLTDGTFTLELLTTAGNVDLSGGDLIDRLELKVANAAKTLLVADGQNVVLTADQTGSAIFDVGTDAGAASQSLTLTLDDETDDANAVDLDTVSITDAKTVTIDGSQEVNAAGGAVEHRIDALTASDANSNITFTMGANNLDFEGTSTVGTGTVTITGSGTVIDSASSDLTAAVFDASANTGGVTIANTLTAGVIKTGSGDDDVVLTDDNGGVFEMNAGADRLTLNSGSLANTTTSINLGDGADVLELQVATQLITGTTGSITLTGVETIELASGANTQEIQGSVLSGQTYAIKSGTTGNSNSVALIVASSDTSLDFSALVEATATADTVAAMTFVTNADANTSSIAITGMSGALNTITGSGVAGDTLTGGSLADSFVYLTDAKLFDTDNAAQDTIVGGASASDTYDTLTVGTSGTAFSIVAADSFASISGVEQIAAVSNTAAIAIELGVTAETAGITRVDLSADAAGTEANSVDVSDYLTTGVTILGSKGANVDTLTGGAGNDTISKDAAATAGATIDGGAGNDTITGTDGTYADTLTGGTGDDTFVYVASLDLFDSSNAAEDTVAGGDGTDTLLVGSKTTTFAITAANSFSGITEVETIKSVATTTAEQTIVLGATAYTAGVRTVDLSDAVGGSSGHTIDVSAYTGDYEVETTLIGSTTGLNTITGGYDDDTITGGSAKDVITGLAGADVIDFGSGLADTLTITTSANGAHDSDSGAIASGIVATAVATSGMDIVTGLDAGDDIHLLDYDVTASDTVLDGVLDTNAGSSGSDLTVTLATNGIFTVRGNHASGVFTESATGADTLFIYDANNDQTETDFEAVVLIGTGSNTFAIDAGATGVISIS